MVYGRRLIPSVIDQLGHTNSLDIWASFPDWNEGRDSVQDVTFQAFANAVNKAAWWIEKELGLSANQRSLAYIGPNDVRYLILYAAVVKTGYKILFSSPRNSVDGHLRLFQQTECTCLLYDPTVKLTDIIGDEKMKTLTVPNLDELLRPGLVPTYKYERCFEKEKDVPVLILHTSGTTSAPKPIILTHGHLATFDAQWPIDPLDGRSTFLSRMAECKQFFVAMPFFHMAGFSISMFLSLSTDVIPIFAHPCRPVSAVSIEKILDSTVNHGAIIPPAILEEMAHSKSSLEKLEKLDIVFYGGAPLAEEAGMAISTRTRLCNQIGSTESIVFTTHLTDAEDWQYLCFNSELDGLEFRQTDMQGLYEMFFVRKEELESYQAVFRNSELTEYSTQDLYSKHPVKSNHWRYEGRGDDVIVFSTGEKWNPMTAEARMDKSIYVCKAMIVGNAKQQPAVVIEPSESARHKCDSNTGFVDLIWPTVDLINQESPSYAQISRSHIVVAPTEKPLQQTAKGGLKRARNVEIYKQEIKGLYDEGKDERLQDIPSIDASNLKALRNFVQDIFINMTNLKDLKYEADVFNAGADSLQVSMAVSKIKRTLDSAQSSNNYSSISARDIYSRPTIAMMTDFLHLLATESSESASFAKESSAPDPSEMLETYCKKLPARCFSPPPTPTECLTVLLTGSTGSLGSYLIDTLIQRADVDEIFCINRGPDSATRQKKSNASKGLSTDWAAKKVNFLQGDLSQPQLGLKSKDFELLSSRTTCIIHNQWPVNFNLTLPSFEPQIQGVGNLISLAAHAKNRPGIFFVSSIASVKNRHSSEGKMVPECATDLSQASGGYGESKTIASSLLERATKVCGISGTVVRLGQVAGPVNRNEGCWNKQEWLPSLIESSKYLGMLPQNLPLLDEVDWIPVDVLADVLVELALSPERHQDRSSQLRYLNVANPAITSWSSLVPVVQTKLGKQTEVVSYTDWLIALKSSAEGPRNPALKLLEFFKGLQQGERDGSQQTRLDTTKAKSGSATLRKLGEVTPDMMNHWLQQW